MPDYEILHRFDTQDSTTLIIRDRNVRDGGFWVLVSSAEGVDHMVRPDGFYIDGSFVDSRDDTPEGDLLGWLGDQDY